MVDFVSVILVHFRMNIVTGKTHVSNLLSQKLDSFRCITEDNCLIYFKLNMIGYFYFLEERMETVKFQLFLKIGVVLSYS